MPSSKLAHIVRSSTRLLRSPVWLAQKSMIVLVAAIALLLVSTAAYEGNLRSVAAVGSYITAAQAFASYFWLIRVRTRSLLFLRPQTY